MRRPSSHAKIEQGETMLVSPCTLIQPHEMSLRIATSRMEEQQLLLAPNEK